MGRFIIVVVLPLMVLNTCGSPHRPLVWGKPPTVSDTKIDEKGTTSPTPTKSEATISEGDINFDTECANLGREEEARGSKICVDCYQLYRDPLILTLCRSDCFKTEAFVHCRIKIGDIPREEGEDTLHPGRLHSRNK